jgi:hypothetical protein
LRIESGSVPRILLAGKPRLLVGNARVKKEKELFELLLLQSTQLPDAVWNDSVQAEARQIQRFDLAVRGATNSTP